MTVVNETPVVIPASAGRLEAGREANEVTWEAHHISAAMTGAGVGLQ